MDAAWYDLVVGRDAELAWLIERWRRARAGEPACAVIVGEKGLGKTRLALQLYRTLSTHEDPGYWPDAFDTGATLDVNPPTPAGPRPMHPIPWLWWGMRFAFPEQRNVVGSRCALSDYRPFLAAHTDALAARLDLPRVVFEALFRTASVAAGALPFVNVAATARDVVLAVRDTARDVTDLRRRLGASAADALDRARDDLKELAIEHCARILEGGRRGKDPIPLILFLDDAHWADSTTLEFVEELLRRARAEHWPFLIVATHWESEWNVSLGAGGPRTLVAVLRAAGLDPVEAARTLDPIGDASRVVRAAFPALPEAQVRMVADRAGGNPLLLHEILRYLERQPRLFDGAGGPLTDGGARHIETREFGLHQIVEERLAALPDDVLVPLLWSSEQGARFLAEVTASVADVMGRARDSVRTGLVRAERPHSIIELEEDPDGGGVGEFRQPVYHEVARQLLALNEGERDAVRDRLRATMIDWLATGEIERLPVAERLDALLIADRLLRPGPDDGAERRSAWETALAGLLLYYVDTGLGEEARRVAEALIASHRVGSGLSHPVRAAVLDWLLSVGDAAEARELVSEGLERARAEAAAPEADPDDGLTVARYLDDLARVELADNRLALATEAFERARTLRDDLLRTEGDSKARLEASADSWIHLGQLAVGLGRTAEGIEALETGIARLRRIAPAETDAGIRWLESSALRTLGDAYVLTHRAADALEPMRRGLAICRDAVATDPGMRRDLVSGLASAGRAARAAGDLARARAWLVEAREVAEDVLRELGETKTALDLLARVSEQEATQQAFGGDADAGREAAERVVALRRRAIDLYGPGPDARLELASALWGVAALGPGEAPREALDACSELLELFLQTPAGRRDALWSVVVSGALDALREVLAARPALAARILDETLGALPAIEAALARSEGEDAWREALDRAIRSATEAAEAAGREDEARRLRARLSPRETGS